MHSNREVIDSMDHVARVVYSGTQTEASKSIIKKVITQDLQMKYRKIHQVPLHLNSHRNLILRQQWAIRFLELY